MPKSSGGRGVYRLFIHAERAAKKSACGGLFRRGCAVRLLRRRLCRRHLANIGVLRAGRAQPLYLLTPAGRFGPSAQVPTGHTLPSGASGGRRKVALLAQGCRIRRACRRIRNTARRAREPSEPPDGWCGERGPAVCAAACDEPRFLCPLDTRNACAQRNRGRPAPMPRAVGAGDAPTAAGAATRLTRRANATRPLLCAAGAWPGGMRRHLQLAAFLVSFGHSKRLRAAEPGQTRTHAASGGRGGRAYRGGSGHTPNAASECDEAFAVRCGRMARWYAPPLAACRVSCVLWTLETLARSGTGADPHPCRGGSERSHARALETLPPGRKEAAPSPAMGEGAARHCFLNNCQLFQPA